ncbi:MAG: hypothetical protein AAB599_03585 [Patescibacteria group bacterium]
MRTHDIENTTSRFLFKKKISADIELISTDAPIKTSGFHKVAASSTVLSIWRFTGQKRS